MGRATDTAVRHVDLARIGLRIGDKLGDRFGWKQRIYQHDRRGIAVGPLTLAEMFRVGDSVIPDLAAAIRTAVAAKSAAIRPTVVGEAAVSVSQRLSPRHRQARNSSGGLAPGERSVKTKNAWSSD